MIRTSRYSRISFQLSRAVIGSDDDSVGITPEGAGHAGKPRRR
jgi:hypothetical protein